MKKIMIAFDGTRFSDGAFEFARRLNELQPILLTGVFIPQAAYANLWSYTGALSGPALFSMKGEEDTESLQENINQFTSRCQQYHISYKVHKDFFDFALTELKRETRFADLLIISIEKFLENVIGGESEFYMREALHASECPVIIVPENYEFPERNVLAYDGSESSVFAIKQFAYLLPEMSNNETLLVYSKQEKESAFPHEIYIEELAAQHFKDLDLLKIDVNPKKFFNGWLNENRKVILVTGSYGRSTFSELFRKSFVADVISGHRIPVFIAHK